MIETDVCIVGGGPAGMVLGLLLAKLGIRVLVLEQHRDFEREYRGEVLMPRFTQMMRQIGLFQELEKCPHLKLEGLEGFYHEKKIIQISISEISPEVPFAIWMPQPVLLNFLYEQAKKFPNFEMRFDTTVKDLLVENGKTAGVHAQTGKENSFEIRAKITVGTDGRFSAVRRQGKFELEDEDYHFDLIWFSIPRPKNYDNQVRFFFGDRYNFLILPKYPDLMQCGLVSRAGEFSELRKKGIENMRQILKSSHPFFHEFAADLKEFSVFNVLQAKIEYVKQWAKDGVMLVGDAAHTCSPAGAVGVSVAVGSAIVAADVIQEALVAGDYSAAKLSKLQQLRQAEVKEILGLQKAFTRNFAARSKFMQAILPIQIWLISRLGIMKRLQRRLMVMTKPLPISPKITMRENPAPAKDKV